MDYITRLRDSVDVVIDQIPAYPPPGEAGRVACTEALAMVERVRGAVVASLTCARAWAAVDTARGATGLLRASIAEAGYLEATVAYIDAAVSAAEARWRTVPLDNSPPEDTFTLSAAPAHAAPTEPEPTQE